MLKIHGYLSVCQGTSSHPPMAPWTEQLGRRSSAATGGPSCKLMAVRFRKSCGWRATFVSNKETGGRVCWEQKCPVISCKINLQHPPAPSPSWPRSWLHRDHGKGVLWIRCVMQQWLLKTRILHWAPHPVSCALFAGHSFYWICQCRRQCQNMLVYYIVIEICFFPLVLIISFFLNMLLLTTIPLGSTWSCHVMPSPSVALLL